MTLTKERVRETLRVLSERRDHVESRLMDVRNRGHLDMTPKEREMETARLTARSYELTFAIEQIEAIELEGLMETGGEVEEVEE